MTPGKEDEPRELRLTRQGAGRYQGSLFRGVPPGLPNARLLIKMARAYHQATVDDLLAWRSVGDWAAGVCITCHDHLITVPAKEGTRLYCPKCGTHTVCNVQDIATGYTPGSVKEIP